MKLDTSKNQNLKPILEYWLNHSIYKEDFTRLIQYFSIQSNCHLIIVLLLYIELRKSNPYVDKWLKDLCDFYKREI